MGGGKKMSHLEHIRKSYVDTRLLLLDMVLYELNLGLQRNIHNFVL